jgi:hypothetical protein
MLPGIGIGVSAGEFTEDWSWWTADQKATNLKFEDQAANIIPWAWYPSAAVAAAAGPGKHA